MVKRLKTVPLQVRISSGIGDALDARVRATKEAQGLDNPYGLKSLAVEEALRLYLEGAPYIEQLFEELLGKYDQAQRKVIGEYSSDPASDLAAIGRELGRYRRRLHELLTMPPTKKEGEA